MRHTHTIRVIAQQLNGGQADQLNPGELEECERVIDEVFEAGYRAGYADRVSNQPELRVVDL